MAEKCCYNVFIMNFFPGGVVDDMVALLYYKITLYY